MKKLFILTFLLLLFSTFLFSCSKEKDPIEILTNTNFDEYHDYDEFKGLKFGAAVKKLEINSSTTINGESKLLWKVSYDEAPDFLYDRPVYLKKPNKHESYIAVNLKEFIDYRDEEEKTYVIVFLVNTDKETAVPVIKYEIKDERVDINGLEKNTNNATKYFINYLYGCLHYWNSDVEFLKSFEEWKQKFLGVYSLSNNYSDVFDYVCFDENGNFLTGVYSGHSWQPGEIIGVHKLPNRTDTWSLDIHYPLVDNEMDYYPERYDTIVVEYLYDGHICVNGVYYSYKAKDFNELKLIYD